MSSNESAKVLAKIVSLTYNIEKNHQYCYVTLENLPSLPGNVLDAIETVSFIDSFSSFQHTIKDNDMFYVNRLVPNLYDKINNVWDVTFGIPVIKFVGHTKALPKAFKDKDIIFFPTHLKNDNTQIIEEYEKVINLLPSFTFVTTTINDDLPVRTSDKNTALSIIKKYTKKISQKRATKSIVKETSNSLMNRWFGNDLTEILLKEAKFNLNTFLHDTHLDIYIPEFVVVYEDRVKHQQRGHEYIQKKYGPQFIMSRHLLHEKINYTILFPVNPTKKG